MAHSGQRKPAESPAQTSDTRSVGTDQIAENWSANAPNGALQGSGKLLMMASSSMSAVRRQCLLDLLGLIEDHVSDGVGSIRWLGCLPCRWPRPSVASSFAAIAQWARNAGSEVLGSLRADRGPAEESTFRRVLAKVDPDRLDTLLWLWLWTRTTRLLDIALGRDGRRVAPGTPVPVLTQRERPAAKESASPVRRRRLPGACRRSPDLAARS